MKVMHIIDSLALGGKERRLLEFLKAIRAYPDVYSSLLVLSDTVDYADAAKIDIPIIHLRRASRKDPMIFAKLFRLCRQYNPDIIHSWESMCSVYAAPIAKLLNIKLVNAMITNASRVRIGSRNWVRSRLTFPLSDLILANSLAGLAAYQAPQRKSACVYNGFDFKRNHALEPVEKIRRACGVHTPHVVGMVATMDDRKDHVNFVRVAVQICEERTDVSFIALGDGPWLERCRKMIPAPLADRILFPGRRAGIESYVQMFDVGLLLTRPDRHGEGISNSIMEYMALAKPVIATRGGGTTEIVADRQTGFLIPSNTDVRLNQCIHHLLDHPAIAAQMGLAGKERIQKEFSIEKMTAEILAWYRVCLKMVAKPLRPEAKASATR